MPLEKLGLSSDGFDTKILLEYHPDKVKQLLAKAGYPNGFTTSIIVSAVQEGQIDLLSIVKAYWAKVGVTLNIDVKEPAVFNTMSAGFTYKDGLANTYANPIEPVKWNRSDALSVNNAARINDPLVQATIEAIQKYYFDWPKKFQIAREAIPEVVSHANLITLPAPYVYALWQPWLKAYYGEVQPDYLGTTKWSRYVWIDRDLKQQMIGKR